MHNSSFCRMAFTLCICLLFSGCAASLSDANAKGKETVTESTSQTDSVDLMQPSDGSSDAAQMKIISSANGNRREDQERQYVQSGFLQIPVCRNLPAGWGHPALRTNWEYRCRSGQFIRHGQLHAEHIAAHIADCADNAVLAALLLHGDAVDAARWFQLRICITACPAPIGVLSVQWCLQEICCR